MKGDEIYHLVAGVEQLLMQNDFNEAEHMIRKAIKDAKHEGIEEGLKRYAWTSSDGKVYVGTCGTTLQKALDLLRNGKL